MQNPEAYRDQSQRAGQTSDSDIYEANQEPVHLLKSLLTDFETSYIFIDGLDEFQSDLGHLLAHIRNAASPQTWFFVTLDLDIIGLQTTA